MHKKQLSFFLIILNIFMASSVVLACDSCVISHVGKENDRGTYVDFTFEGQNWNSMTAREAHNLHHDGHHVHNKTHEEIYHLEAGFAINEKLSIAMNVPYVVRSSIEIDDHDRLGQKEESAGIGDAYILGTYRAQESGDGFWGMTGGVKLPTGQTNETNSADVLFEPELQPGTGSWDFPLGIVYVKDWRGVSVRGNFMLLLRTEGDNQFEQGDLFSTGLFLGKHINSRIQSGLDINFQMEDQEIHEGDSVPDSGGSRVLVGPALTFNVCDNWQIKGGFQIPVHQNLGGMHQELDFIWTLGSRASW